MEVTFEESYARFEALLLGERKRDKYKGGVREMNASNNTKYYTSPL